MALAAIGLTPIFPVIAVVPVVVIPVFDKTAKDAAAPRFTGAGLVKARALCPVPNVSVITNAVNMNKRTILLSER